MKGVDTTRGAPRLAGTSRLRLALAPDDLDPAATLQTEMSVGHDLVAGRDSLLDQHPATDRGTGRHTAKFNRLIRLDDPDEIAARTMAQRRRGHRHAAVAGIDRDAAVDEIAGPQLQARIRKARLQ